MDGPCQYAFFKPHAIVRTFMIAQLIGSTLLSQSFVASIHGIWHLGFDQAAGCCTPSRLACVVA